MAPYFHEHAFFARADRRKPLVFGHRGASALETENTLPAFRRAMADGADGVELDVQRCASGEIVVFHDDDLARLAGRPERIDQLSRAALRQIRLLPGGEIPTLADAIEASGSDALVNVEIKYAGIRPSGCRALVAGTAETIARAGAENRVIVSSFSPAAIWLWRRIRPDVPCGLLFERPRPFRKPWPLRTDLLLPLLRPAAVHPEQGLCDVASVAAWRRRGFAVNVWTVDDPFRLRTLANLGVTGIITNDPGKTRDLLTLTPRSMGV